MTPAWKVYMLSWDCRCRCRYIGVTGGPVELRVKGSHNDEVQAHKRLLHTHHEIMSHCHDKATALDIERDFIRQLRSHGVSVLNRTHV